MGGIVAFGAMAIGVAWLLARRLWILRSRRLREPGNGYD